MRTVELVPGIKSSVLGFGCASILGAVGGAAARRALGVALDEGITHFDLARSYGYGDAESFVGRYLKGRRGQVVLATKFGIRATASARLLQPLKPLVRWAKKLKGHSSPSTVHRPPSTGSPSSGATTLGDRFHARVALEPANLRASVETSLRELRTDYLDYLFLHEPREVIEGIDALAEEAARLKMEGKIRAWGLAFMRDRLAVHAPVLPRFDVLQYDLSPDGPGYERVRNERAGRPNIFFSPFRGASASLPRNEVLARLGTDFPRSVVLCSMFNPDHIRANARVI